MPPQLNEEDAKIPESCVPGIPQVLGESLEDTCQRVIPFWKDNILNEIRSGKNIMISAHGNSLRPY